MTEDSAKIKSILENIKSTDPNLVLNAIKNCRKEGNAKTFKAMIDALKDTDEPTVEESIIEFIFDLKDEESAPILIEAIQNKDMEFYHNFLIAAFWQSAIDGSDYLAVFIKAAIDGEYISTLEALTVIENFDSAFSQSDLIEYEADLTEAIENEENEDKKVLLESMADVVRNLPIEGE